MLKKLCFELRRIIIHVRTILNHKFLKISKEYITELSWKKAIAGREAAKMACDAFNFQYLLDH